MDSCVGMVLPVTSQLAFRFGSVLALALELTIACGSIGRGSILVISDQSCSIFVVRLDHRVEKFLVILSPLSNGQLCDIELAAFILQNRDTADAEHNVGTQGDSTMSENVRSRRPILHERCRIGCSANLIDNACDLVALAACPSTRRHFVDLPDKSAIPWQHLLNRLASQHSPQVSDDVQRVVVWNAG
jgi:hypothetical protein